jgi:CubicO group peptidase (beta-lactamase class C family)
MLLRSLAATLLLPILAFAQFVPDVVTYLDVNAASHQLSFTNLSNQGYRPISLSMAGGLASPRYSAVWIRRSGSTFIGVHGMTPAAYRSWTITQRLSGYRPLLLAAAGALSDSVCAAVWVRDGVDAVDDVDLSDFEFTNENDAQRGQGRRLRNAAVSGTISSPRYAAIWEANPDHDAWCWHNSSSARYAGDFAARVDGYGRLVSAMSMPNGNVGQVWADDNRGGFVALPDLTRTQLEAEITTRRPTGAYPVDIKQTGASIAARFHVVFATRDQPVAKTLTKTGLPPTIALGRFDDLMEDLIARHGIRNSAIAIAKDGRLVFARGYTYAEPSAAPTEPTSLFRIASVSKPFAALMTHLLIQRGTGITEDSRVATVAALSSTSSSFRSITLGQLMSHTSGLSRDVTSYTIARHFNSQNPALPISNRQSALWMAATNPAFTTPGVTGSYSNLGNELLSSAIEQHSGKTFERFLREDLAAPFGVTRIWIAGNERSQLRAGEVEYRTRTLRLSESEIHTDRRTVPEQFGGDFDDNLARSAGSGGILTSVVDCVRIFSGAFDLTCDGGPFTQSTIDRLAVLPAITDAATLGGFARADLSNGVVSLGKAGTVAGCSTQFVRRSDGVTIAVFCGKRDAHADRAELNLLASAVTDWPTHDLFPNYGLASFQRQCPRVYSHAPLSVPNLTDTPIVIDGDVLSGVDLIDFGNQQITSRGSNTWATGWFRIVNDDRIELHVPQGLMPGNYSVTVRNGIFASAPITVGLVRATERMLGAPSSSFVGYDLIASRGGSSSASTALLCYSTSDTNSLLPGIVSLGIGAQFTQLWTWPASVPFNTFTGCARWQVPDLGNLRLHFQALVLDPNSINPLPFPVTNVRSVSGI